ncbi:DUF397 domain-containing protein [Asanoa sp. NPDC050611]|uniref:DUF397 domain-containing protein n=1 Tax=Asanoa sp. NPDC050611 TaxID=3157098 RepID=UPI0033D66B14
MNRRQVGNWTRSSQCNIDQCVEVSFGETAVLMRDGKRAEQSPVLTFAADTWRSFIADTKSGAFDVDRNA